MGYVCIAATILLTIYGQLVLYWRVAGRDLLPDGFRLEEIVNIVRMILDPWILSGFAAAFLASIFYMIALSRFQINHAYPFMSLTFPLVAICAFFLFGDALSMKKLLGLGLIVSGLILSSHATSSSSSKEPTEEATTEER
jgi:drug/metabolite transporter (DMT)-like permease